MSTHNSKKKKTRIENRCGDDFCRNQHANTNDQRKTSYEYWQVVRFIHVRHKKKSRKHNLHLKTFPPSIDVSRVNLNCGVYYSSC